MAIVTDDDSPHKSSKQFEGNIQNNVQKDIKLALKLMPVSFSESKPDLVDFGCPRGFKNDSREDTKSQEKHIPGHTKA